MPQVYHSLHDSLMCERANKSHRHSEHKDVPAVSTLFGFWWFRSQNWRKEKFAGGLRHLILGFSLSGSAAVMLRFICLH